MTKAVIHCPPPQRLSRSAHEGPTEELATHLEQCQQCKQLWLEMERVVDVATQLPWDRPDAGRLRAAEASLLAAAEAPPQRSSLWSPTRLGVAAVAAAALAMLAVSSLSTQSSSTTTAVVSSVPDAGPTLRGTVSQHGTAALLHSSVAGDEVVRLTSGTISASVETLDAGERFRVIAGDGEVEVRGTLFDVTVLDDSLVSVAVHSGRVEVRPHVGPLAILQAGERWQPVPTESASVPGVKLSSEHAGSGRTTRESHAIATPTPAPTLIRPPAPTPIPTPAIERAFADGFAALRAGDYGTAERAFARGIAAAPTRAAFAEDARFWRAVALSRAGRDLEAATAYQRFLSDFPSSPRAAEATLALGWLELGAGELTQAQEHFTGLRDHGVAAIRDSAQAGLQEVARRRTPR